MTLMKSITEDHEVRAKWFRVLKAQGRKLTWLAQATDISYPVATHYAQKRTEPPPEWLDKVSELLGEDVR